MEYWTRGEAGDLLGVSGCHQQIWARPERKGTGDELIKSNEEFMFKKKNDV
jgi:hypothetical protein